MNWARYSAEPPITWGFLTIKAPILVSLYEEFRYFGSMSGAPHF